jgi:hypothetical protein
VPKAFCLREEVHGASQFRFKWASLQLITGFMSMSFISYSSQCSFTATTVGSAAAAAAVAALVWAEPRRRPGVPRRVAPLHLGLRLWLGPDRLHEKAAGDQTGGLGRADDAAVAWDRLSHSQRTPSALPACRCSQPSGPIPRAKRAGPAG